VKILKFIGGLVIAIIVIKAIAGDKDGGSSASSSPTAAIASPSTPRPPSAQEQMRAMMPTDQAGLMTAVEDARRQYASAPNDMAKGASRPVRAQAICRVLRNRSVNNWVGVVENLSTNGDGKGVLEIQIGPKTSVKTWNNSLSDIGSRTLIEPSSSLFATASQLRIGQLVRFSGTLIQDDTDCVREASMSLSGSINDPEFIIRFQSVSAAN
jgi:hypothetical protein